MHWISNISPLIKEVELRKPPLIIRVNKFDDDSAKKFADEMASCTQYWTKGDTSCN